MSRRYQTYSDPAYNYQFRRDWGDGQPCIMLNGERERLKARRRQHQQHQDADPRRAFLPVIVSAGVQ